MRVAVESRWRGAPARDHWSTSTDGDFRRSIGADDDTADYLRPATACTRTRGCGRVAAARPSCLPARRNPLARFMLRPSSCRRVARCCLPSKKARPTVWAVLRPLGAT